MTGSTLLRGALCVAFLACSASVATDRTKPSPADLVIGEPVTSTVAWVYERAGGGRAFGYTGGRYLAAFDQPTVRNVCVIGFHRPAAESPKRARSRLTL